MKVWYLKHDAVRDSRRWTAIGEGRLGDVETREEAVALIEADAGGAVDVEVEPADRFCDAPWPTTGPVLFWRAVARGGEE